MSAPLAVPRHGLPEECSGREDLLRGPRSEGTRGGWVGKVIQLYETKVRHGIMLVGPTGGKSTIFAIEESIAEIMDLQHRAYASTRRGAQQMYGKSTRSARSGRRACSPRCGPRPAIGTTPTTRGSPRTVLWMYLDWSQYRTGRQQNPDARERRPHADDRQRQDDVRGRDFKNARPPRCRGRASSTGKG